MAKPGLRNHRKFRKLRARLRMPAVYVTAHLQAMWEVAYESANPFLGSADDVELAAEWEDSERQQGDWFAAVLEAGFIDEVPGGYAVHDLFEHAPRYVKLRASRNRPTETKDLQTICAHTERQPAHTERDAAHHGAQRALSHPIPALPKRDEINKSFKSLSSPEREEIDRQIDSFQSDHPDLQIAAAHRRTMRSLSASVGWDRTRQAIEDSIDRGAGNPIAYAVKIIETAARKPHANRSTTGPPSKLDRKRAKALGVPVEKLPEALAELERT